jgi:hypothetical protein
MDREIDLPILEPAFREAFHCWFPVSSVKDPSPGPHLHLGDVLLEVEHPGGGRQAGGEALAQNDSPAAAAFSELLGRVDPDVD